MSEALQILVSFFASLSFIPFHNFPLQLYFLSQPSDLTRVASTLSPNMGSLLCYVCNIWEVMLSQLHFSIRVIVLADYIFAWSPRMVESILCPSDSSTSLPTPSHRHCVALLLCRGSVPKGQVGGLFLASTWTEIHVEGGCGSSRSLLSTDSTLQGRC